MIEYLIPNIYLPNQIKVYLQVNQNFYLPFRSFTQVNKESLENVLSNTMNQLTLTIILQITLKNKAKLTLTKFTIKKNLNLSQCNWPSSCILFSKNNSQSWWTLCYRLAFYFHKNLKYPLQLPEKSPVIFISILNQKNWKPILVDLLRIWQSRRVLLIWV